MRQIVACTVLALCMVVVARPRADVPDIPVSAYGRGIQCDGFLMEWDEQLATAVPGFPAAAWDASNTPQALAGYVRVPSGDSCGTIVLDFAQPDRDPPWRLTVTDSVSEGEHFAATVQGSWRVVEFALPWTELRMDSSHVYAVQMTLEDGCGNSSTWRLIGSSKTPLARILTPKVVQRIVVVLVLLMAYAALYLRLKLKRNRRTQ